ncbi:T9SS type A sorting domain-containing protein [Taibaiella koreensis]|uniref:T9SS type A sorting domain-containing protein n=1 Tax=Taibaiella koreensis TaxID=1268548 RepID=UPI000E59BFE7|nr:T9SS type A sorting domain-containing protein [Taibaiella koreensis]
MIRQLFSIAALAALFPLSAGAQIRYYDITPDTTLGATAGMVSSFTFHGAIAGSLQLLWSDMPGIGVLGHPGIEVLCGAGGLPDKLNSGADISSALSCWYENALKPLSQDGTGNWLSDANDKYLGFRIPAAGGARYGWIRLTVTNGSALTCTVKDWACNETLNQPIKAGQTSNTTGISLRNNLEGVRLIREEQAFGFSGLNPATAYRLMLVTGQGSVVLRRELKGNEWIAVPQLASGMYLLRLEGPEGAGRFKLLVR